MWRRLLTLQKQTIRKMDISKKNVKRSSKRCWPYTARSNQEDHVWMLQAFSPRTGIKYQIRSMLTITQPLSLISAKQKFRKFKPNTVEIYDEFFDEDTLGNLLFGADCRDIWKLLLFILRKQRHRQHCNLWDLLWNRIGIISANLILMVKFFANSLYMYCFIWKRTVKIKIIKRVLCLI